MNKFIWIRTLFLFDARNRAASKPHLDLFQAFVDSVDAKEHITEVLDKEQATRAGDGFCAAVSLKDGKFKHNHNSAILAYFKNYTNSSQRAFFAVKQVYCEMRHQGHAPLKKYDAPMLCNNFSHSLMKSFGKNNLL